MEQKPRKRRGLLIFSLVFLLVAGSISATVLLANNKRNLNLLLRQAGFETRSLVIPKPGKMEAFRGKRLQGVAVMLPDSTFVAPVKAKESAFLRSLQKNGEALCDLFDKAGFKMTPWEAGGFAKSVLECWNELTIPNAAKPDEPSTFFLIVKGTAEGQIVSTRVKFIFSDETERARLSKLAADVLTLFAGQTGWGELAEDSPKILSLTPFAVSNFGVSVKFAAEFSGTGRYNLIIAAAPRLPPQKRTEDYFNRKNYYPLLPEHGGPPIAAVAKAPEG